MRKKKIWETKNELKCRSDYFQRHIIDDRALRGKIGGGRSEKQKYKRSSRCCGRSTARVALKFHIFGLLKLFEQFAAVPLAAAATDFCAALCSAATCDSSAENFVLREEMIIYKWFSRMDA